MPYPGVQRGFREKAQCENEPSEQSEVRFEHLRSTDDTGIAVRWKLRCRDSLPEPDLDVTWWPAADERRVRAGEPRDVVTAMERMREWLRGPGDDRCLDCHAPIGCRGGAGVVSG